MDIVVENDYDGTHRLRFPEPFNSATYFIDRHLAEHRGERAAIRTLHREVSYTELTESTNRFGNALKSLGIRAGDRV